MIQSTAQLSSNLPTASNTIIFRIFRTNRASAYGQPNPLIAPSLLDTFLVDVAMHAY